MNTEKNASILLLISDARVEAMLRGLLEATGFQPESATDEPAALRVVELRAPALALVDENFGSGFDFAAELTRHYPALPVVFLALQESAELLRRALRLGLADVLFAPLRPEEVVKAVQAGVGLAQQRRNAALLEARRATTSLQRQLDEYTLLARLGRAVTGSLDLDTVLQAVVGAAVELTGAEEGSLLLLDVASGELYMRASRNFQEEFVRTFRLPVDDSIAGQVIHTGQPVLLDQTTPQKIKTSYLVQSLVYVPLQLDGRVLGVLGVDNRQSHTPFSARHVNLLAALAEFAVIALKNAELFGKTSAERNRLETILAGIQDGIIVVDAYDRLVMTNQVVRAAFNLGDEDLSGQPLADLIPRDDLLDLLQRARSGHINWAELELDDGRVYAAEAVHAPGVGYVLTLNNITNLKRLDRVKSEFVNTVSHDLRSPLTAILLYLDLIDRSGPLNPQQKEFLSRMASSVASISALVDDLLNLGRIESGFDLRNESIDLKRMLADGVDLFRARAEDRAQQLELELPDTLPPVFGNPVQLRQMLENLLENALKYTPPGGCVRAGLAQEDDQVILRVQDTGIGIPTAEQPYVFDKFFRASNTNDLPNGTGLGLSIVRSVVESHGGRVWVESTVGVGSTFTVVLPLKNFI